MTNKRIYDLSENSAPAAGDFLMIDKDGDGAARKVDVAAFVLAGAAEIDQADTGGARPALLISQADVSEEIFEFTSTVGVGNAIEAVGAKTLTVTHFVKATITGVGTVYLPVGTIA